MPSNCKASKTKYAHSEKVESRRKALFPSDDADSDLGHMSPIHSEVSTFSESTALNALESEANSKLRKFFKCSLDDYILLDRENDDACTSDAFSESHLPSMHTSSLHSLIATPILYSPLHDKSPSSTLKTPHDMSTVKINQKLTKRKLVLRSEDEADENDTNAANSAAKQAKIQVSRDSSKSRVRTALFPDAVVPVLSVKNFYPRGSSSYHRTGSRPQVVPTSAKNRARSSKRAISSSRKRYGEINAGVRHNIRKPKQKKVTRAKIAKATMKMMEKSHEYLHEITSIKTTIKSIVKGKEHVEQAVGNTSDSDLPGQDAAMLFSPTTEMCDMASAMQLNSPKRAKLNITKMFDEGDFDRSKELPLASKKITASAKLFSIFTGEASKARGSPPGTKKSHSGQQKRIRAVTDDQMLLDAGQKRFGPTKCHECNIVYDAGDPTDEIMHQKYHSAINTFKFNGWKNERIVTAIDYESKIIKLIPGDSKNWWRKAEEVLQFVNRELGFYDGILPVDKSQVYFYIKCKKIVGCLVAEMKPTAHKLLSTGTDIDFCSEEAYNIRCGVSRIWVAPQHRRVGFAKQMLDTLRRNFLHGYMLSLHEIALSSPTEMGKQFAKNYFNTDNILIYLQ